MDLDQFRDHAIKNNISEIERFLLYVTDNIPLFRLTENDKRNLARVYHRLWWFRDMQIKRYFPDIKFTSYPTFIFPEYKLSAEQDLEGLLRLQSDFPKRIDAPKELRENMKETLAFFVKKEKSGERNEDNFYISKREDGNFYYKGRLLKLSKKAEYYVVFSILYSELPDGGEIEYKKLIKKVAKPLPKIKDLPQAKQITYLQKKLTEKVNGFMGAAKLSDFEDNQKPLIDTCRGTGFIFNNRRG